MEGKREYYISDIIKIYAGNLITNIMGRMSESWKFKK
jgi:hypothetical protein